MWGWLWRAPALPLMRVRGIPVEVHWTIVILLMGLGGLLAQTAFLGWYPEVSSSAIAAMALVTVLLDPVWTLLHELGHSIQAQREGLRAEKITLWGGGGVAWITGDRSPASSFRITAAGPLVSALLAVVLGALAWLGAQMGLPEAVVGVTLFSALLNALAFTFNLLPAYPMDGGRILYAALWRLKGAEFALTWAVRVAIVVACSLVAFGFVFPFLGVSDSEVPVYVSLSVFFTVALMLWMTLSSLDSAQLSTPAPRTAVVVGDMVNPLESRPGVAPHTTITEFLEATSASDGWRTSASPIVEGRRVLGVLSPRLADGVPVEERSKTTTADLMVREADANVLTYDTPVQEALHTLQEAASSFGIVRDGKRVTALILASDLADMLLQIKDLERGIARPVRWK